MINNTQAKYLSILDNGSTCEDSTRKIFDIFNVVSYLISVILFSILLGIHFTIRYTFHPIFSFYISLLFLGYILCDAAIVVSAIIGQLNESVGQVMAVFDTISSLVYTYLFPLVLFATVERLAATLLVKRYESLRPWNIVIASQILCVGIISGLYALDKDEMGGRIRNYITISIEVCIYAVVITLFVINRRRTRSRKFFDLTCRYQMVENIRSCRFLLIFVIFDSLIAATDLIADVGCNITTEFEPDRCPDPSYLPTFTIFRIMSVAFELAIPGLLATVGHASYRNRLKRLLCLQRRRVIPSKHRYHTKMRNVLGEQVETSHTIDQYFTRLNSSWENSTCEKTGRKY